MKWLKRLPALVIAVMVLCLTGVTAYAHEVPDPSRVGTISVTMSYDNAHVPGGSVTLIRVGDVVQDDGNYGFALNDDFAASGVSLDDLQSPSAAKALANWADDHGLSGVTEEISGSGVATFSDVKTGLYVVAQHEAAEGYYAIDPFLVGMPLNEDGSYVYDVDASPKLELVKLPPSDEEVPNTGEGALPVGELTACGIAVLAAAFALVAWRRRAVRRGEDAS